MSCDGDTPLEAQLRVTLRTLLADLVGLGDEAELALEDPQLLGYEFGLESIEFVALLDQLHERLGISLESMTAGARSPADVLDRLSVRWVIDHAVQVVTNRHQPLPVPFTPHD